MIFWTEKLIAFAIVLQTLELLAIAPAFSDQGIWRWTTLRREFEIFSRPTQTLFKVAFNARGFSALLALRLIAAILLLLSSESSMLHAPLDLFLWLSTLLIALRWRGTFNGGSDIMTLVVCLGAFLGRLTFEKAGMYFIAIQACASYFIAGIAKIRNPDWRSGQALAHILKTPSYGVPPWTRVIPPRAGAWGVMLFECGFPLALADPRLCAAALVAAFGFHCANAEILGLNRFVWAWLAAYPAIYSFSIALSST